MWSALMGVIFVPLYIHFIGIEAYGLMGIFSTLLAVFGLLDMGLSNTLNREMARLSSEAENAQEMRDLVRTLERPYWALALGISIVVVLLSSVIAHHWVNADQLSPSTIRVAVVLMGVAIAFQWPKGLYAGGLMGLQRQVLLNGINATMATFRGLGAVLVLWLVSPTVEAFFYWQILVSMVDISVIVFFLWRSLPRAARAPRFRRELLQNIWRFAAGIAGITALATVLTQLDKIILSRLLTLEQFGYYMLAYVVAMTLYRFVGPVFAATYPRFTNLVAMGASREIVSLYHRSAQLVSVLVLPLAMVLAFFSEQVLLIWTRDAETAANAHVLTSILVTGTAINSMSQIPNALQLASGWLRLSLMVNFLSVLLLVPLMITLTRAYGPVGAASVWLILNCGYIFISVPIMHHWLIPDEKWRWYVSDVGRPFVAACAVAGGLRLTLPLPANDLGLALCILLVSGATLSITALATPVTRDWLQSHISMRASYAD